MRRNRFPSASKTFDTKFDAALWAAKVEAAMRAGELLVLQLENIKGSGAILLDTKNGDPRRVPLFPRARGVLAELPRRFDGRVFPPIKNDNIPTPTGVQRGWRHRPALPRPASRGHITVRLAGMQPNGSAGHNRAQDAAHAHALYAFEG